MSAGHAGSLLADESVDFLRRVRPVLNRCVPCHGFDPERQDAGLSLESRLRATAKLESGAHAIVPGKPEKSELLVRVAATDDRRMPPPEAGPPLTATEVEILHRWIAEGAEYQTHWAFSKPQRRTPPTVEQSNWVRNPIDQFILRRLEAAGLSPAPGARPERLLRRVSLDLTGLPPTVEEQRRFSMDHRPDAYERAVDRLLESPRYGEHWARMWLDLARYADSQGYANDNLRTIWPYRDWVIRAFNRDLAFDQFTIEQLAGDLLPNSTDDQLTATAFHRNTMTNDEGGTDDEEFRHAAVVDRTNTTMQVWMGMTAGCAQCHSHKYDPLTHEEYYRLFAFFNQTSDADRNDNEPVLNLATPKQTKRLKQIDAARREAKGGRAAELRQQRTLLLEQIAAAPIMRELPPDKQRTTHIHLRGAFLDKGDPVEPGTPSVFHPWDSERFPPNRLGLAKWLVASENPLTARVAVNRHWEKLFGVGLVRTSEDFGTQGELPTHPELLDWLALEFVECKWSMKQLCRLIVTSATYRQSSQTTPEKLSVDRENRLLARGPRRRLTAEQIRDYALSTAGLLSGKMFGPPVRPPQPRLGLRAAFGTSLDWETSTGEDRYRRGLYTRWRRLAPYPSMAALDAPSRVTCTVRRIQTNTPVGVFVTLNDPAFVEAAQNLARLVLAKADATPVGRIRYAFQRVLARPPSRAETARIEKLLQQQLEAFQDDEQAARQLSGDNRDVPRHVHPAELASWTVVSNVLLNLDEALTIN